MTQKLRLKRFPTRLLHLLIPEYDQSNTAQVLLYLHLLTFGSKEVGLTPGSVGLDVGETSITLGTIVTFDEASRGIARVLTVAVIPRVVDLLSEAALKCVTEVVDALIDPNFIELETVLTVASDLEDHLMENGVISEVEIPSRILEVSGEDLKAVDEVWKAVTIVLVGDQLEVMGEIVGITDVACEVVSDVTDE